MNNLAGVITDRDTHNSHWSNVLSEHLELESGAGDESFRPVGTRIAICASWIQALSDSGLELLAAPSPLLFWDVRTRSYLSGQRLTSNNMEQLIASIQRGLLIPALDVPWVAVDGRRNMVRLFASCSGASTLYTCQAMSGAWSFSDRPRQLKDCRRGDLDRLGIAEVVRFGANYGERTPLQSLRRIPFGHSLARTSGGDEQRSSFVDLTYEPSNRSSFDEVLDQTKASLELNLRQFSNANAHLLFSGGVDSSLLAVIGKDSGAVSSGSLLSMGLEDPQTSIALDGAHSLGLNVNVVNLRQSWSDVERAIRSYALPTLDFSIVPTLQLGVSAVENQRASVLLDGTGGDAWFGFGSIKHARFWRKLHPGLKWLRAPSSWLFARRLQSSASRWLYPMMLAARMPTRNVGSLGHLCANVAYREQLNLTPQEWDEIEDSLLSLIGRISKCSLQDDVGQVIVSDAALIAIAQFAAKSSQWTLRERAQTVYPFLMPNMVEIGRRLPTHMLVRKGVTKAVLKEMAVRAGLSRDYVFRPKSGFQPPLHRILSDPENISRAMAWLDRDDDLNAVWTDFTKQSARKILGSQKPITIKALYVVWSLLSMRIWMDHFRA